MKVLAWMGSKKVELIRAPVSDVTELDSMVLAVTGTTICGSDLHFCHGEILALQRGDFLGHEVCLPYVLKNPRKIIRILASLWAR